MIRLQSIVDGWNRFFFKPESPLPIAVYRILFGVVVLMNQALLLPELEMWFGESGVLPSTVAKASSGGGGLNVFDHISTSNAAVWSVFWLSIITSITLAAGLATRVSAVLLWVCVVSLNHRNPVLLNSGDTFIRIALFFVIFSHAGAALSVDRWWRVKRGKESGPPAPRAPWAMRLIQLQLAVLYFYAFVWKTMGTMWIGGTALYYTSRLPEFFRFPMPYVFEHMWTIKLATWGTLVLEFALGVLVWVKELRYWVLLGGLLLHAGIDYTMNIPLFGFIMVSAYVTFIAPEDLEGFLRWAKSKLKPRRSAGGVATNQKTAGA